MENGRIYSFSKGVISNGVLDFSRRTPFVREVMLEKINPARIILPMKMNYGVPCEPVVKVGDQVKVGQCIGMPKPHTFASPVHSGISGTVTDIKPVTLPNGISCMAVFIENDMKRTTVDSIRPRSHMNMSAKETVAIIRAAGICGMGGEGIPSAGKISRAKRHGVNELLVNCLQSEPFATCDLTVINEHTDYVVRGACAVATTCGAKKIRFLISHRRKSEIKMLQSSIDSARDEFEGLEFEICRFRDRYPQGYYRLVAKALYGKNLAEGAILEEECKAVMFNCSTLYAVWRALADNMPMTERIVSVCTDSYCRNNVLVPIGTPLSEIVNNGSVAMPTNDRIIWGNCLTGIEATDPENTPVIKITSAVTVAPKNFIPKTPCIHCGLCSETCPMGLSPNIVYEMLIQGLSQKAAEEGGRDCIACGTCSYICPAGIDLASMIAPFASAGRIIEENSLLHNTSFSSGSRKEGEEDLIGEISLLEEFVEDEDYRKAVDPNEINLPFKGGKKV